MHLTRRSLLSGVAVTGLIAAVGCVNRTLPPPSDDAADAAAPLASDTNAWLEIDRSAFIDNIRIVRRQLSAGVKCCVVLKADAYGHGVGLLMPAVLAEGITVIGITSNHEARAVRSAGFRGDLLRIRTATIGEIEAGFAYDLEETIGNLELARQAAKIARSKGRKLRVHFMLNSAGMSRNGMELSTEQGKADAQALVGLDGLEIVGLATHYPVDQIDDCQKSAARFESECAWLIKNARLDRQKLTLHSANSFAALAVPSAQNDMVRTGRALYGCMGAKFPQLRGVATYKSRVASVNPYPKGNTVSYDRTVTLDRDSLLANIPVGYSDGYDRKLSDKGEVLIRGRRAPVKGRVTMNTIMVDVTDIPGVRADDEVVLFGRQGGSEITQEELEARTGNILTAELTLWGNSVPRVLKI